MLPTPAIPDWSSRNDFSGAFFPAAISPSFSGVNSGDSGSTPRREKRSGSFASSIRKASPKRRGSVNHTSRPSASTKMFLFGRALALVEDAALGGVDDLPLGLDQHEVAGHPQVHDQRLVAVQAQQQVLAASSQTQDRAPVDLLAERCRSYRPRPAFVTDFQLLDRAPFELRLELACDGLDLGQLRHARSSTRPAPSGA